MAQLKWTGNHDKQKDAHREMIEIQEMNVYNFFKKFESQRQRDVDIRLPVFNRIPRRFWNCIVYNEIISTGLKHQDRGCGTPEISGPREVSWLTYPQTVRPQPTELSPRSQIGRPVILANLAFARFALVARLARLRAGYDLRLVGQNINEYCSPAVLRS